MRQSDWVTEYRQAITDSLKGIAKLKELSEEASYNNWPDGMDANVALAGTNASITMEQLTSAMQAASSIMADIDSSEMAALYKVRA